MGLSRRRRDVFFRTPRDGSFAENFKREASGLRTVILPETSGFVVRPSSAFFYTGFFFFFLFFFFL